MKKARREELETINKIVKRALGIEVTRNLIDDPISLFMDIDSISSGLDLSKFLSFDNFNFCHDVFGIIENMNKETGKLENCFLPRCSR